ncbi:hypothetical protein AB0F13_12650 [Streptomyces sp. NPDC026206]|uniref:hypothetical protein n=1 Tax=Streptomyces sp. NPDC026206 TaxID=3157089 RepID=UPI0033E87574
MAITRARKALFTAIAGSAAAVAAFSALGIAHADPQTPIAAADADMPLAIENHAYPGAAQIQQNQQILLKRGDGNITFATCDGTNAIRVRARNGQKSYCFNVRGTKGWVTLELEDSFGMWTKDHPVKATISTDGKQTVVDAPANDYKPIGEAGDISQRSMLVELRVTS